MKTLIALIYEKINYAESIKTIFNLKEQYLAQVHEIDLLVSILSEMLDLDLSWSDEGITIENCCHYGS